MELPTGTIVDNSYRISAPIRLDKNGDVYRGEPIAPGPPVMIHILRTALMEGDPGLEVFERAGLELCRFSHDAFPEVVDYGRFMVRPYLITEMVEAKPLSQAMEAGDISADRAVDLVDEIRQALHAAHEAGMTHGALSTDNVMLSEDGQVKIVDLFVRWVAQQIHSKGAEIDTSADLRALVDISQQLMKSAKRDVEVEEAQVLSSTPVDIAADLDFNRAPVAAAQIIAIQTPTTGRLNLQALADEEEDAPPRLWEEFTPEPEIDMFAAKATVVAMPESTPVVAPVVSPVVMLQSPTPIIVAKPMPPPPPVEVKPAAPIVVSSNAPKVRLPPPPASTGVGHPLVPQASLPKPAPKVEAVRAPIQRLEVKLPVPTRTARPRIESFTPTSAVATASRIQLDDDPFVSSQLQPGYIDFFKRMFPRSGLETKTGSENGFSRSFNLLLTCSVALLMLAMVLRF